MKRFSLKRFYVVVVCILSVSLQSCTKKSEPVTLSDYQRAEKMLGVNTSQLVSGMISGQAWLKNDQLFYKTSTLNGWSFVLADPASNEKKSAFDHDKLAAALIKLGIKEVKATKLEITQVDFSEDGTLMSFNTDNKRFQINLATYDISKIDSRIRNEHLSPNGKLAAFIKDNNLWVRDLETGKTTPLTFDGKEDYGYGTNNAGWTRGEAPVLLWSPNSDKIATFQHDGRGVGEMYLYTTQVGHSKLDKWKYPLPGDSVVFRIERVVIHVNPQPKVVRLKIPPDAHRSTISDHIANRNGEFLDVEWSTDGTQLAFVSSTRDHKSAKLQVANPYTGEVREVLNETVPTYFESGSNEVNWHILKESNEVIWFSERDNWGHLYLYDLATGVLKNQITKGDWRVLQVLHIDAANRLIYFTGSNKEEGDPYFQYLYSIGFDGTNLKNLTPENAYHNITFSQSNNFFTDEHSTPTSPPTSVIRNRNGEIVMELEKGDITSLLASGWVAPTPFKVKARDNETDLYGLMYKPSNFDPSKKYPILNYLYPGPQSGSVGSRAFSPARGDKQAIAELGFIVVEVDAMGTPNRSKSFHDAYYGNMGDNGLPDQITMIKQLAAENTWMDIDKVGIWGHSGGGFASTDAILRYPDFYKVAVSGAGNHDNRNYEDDWGEKWQGLLVKNPTQRTDITKGQQVDLEIQKAPAETNYDNQANQLLAPNLKGKLLIAHGMMDGNVPPTNTLLVVDALIKADKDFDMLVLPNAGHGFGNGRYFMKKRWDYFVRHLKNQEPPSDFLFDENVK
jgi:dipeptidyl aminopeptidase/acylaminoacyl peptidase